MPMILLLTTSSSFDGRLDGKSALRSTVVIHSDDAREAHDSKSTANSARGESEKLFERTARGQSPEQASRWRPWSAFTLRPHVALLRRNVLSSLPVFPS